MRAFEEKYLTIRVDAGTQIGTGHLMRCLALAHQWKDNDGQVVFITSCQDEGLLQRLRQEEFSIHKLTHPHPDPNDWNHTKDILAAYPNTWVVLDGYHFDEAYQHNVKVAGHELLVIDDMAHLSHYDGDIILNHNLYAEQLSYSCPPETQLLLGTRYVPLRREFLTWKGWKREISGFVRRMLVTLGGSDSENHTLKVIYALQKADVPDLEIIVVVGASYPHTDALQSAIRQGHLPIRIVRNAENMPELMAWADVGISSAGTTIWEFLFLETPILALVIADNQQRVAEELEQHQVGKNLGWVSNISTDFLVEAINLFMKDARLRVKMSNNARRIVDGQGARRVINSMKEKHGYKIKLRPVTMDDCHLLWEWRNDSDVRAASFNTHQVQWDDHVNWFNEKLGDSHCLVYIATNEQGIPFGQVRFDINSERKAEVSISIDARERKKGYGNAVLKLACQRIWREFNIIEVLAHIKGENEVSISAFAKADFINKGLQDFNGNKSVEMVWLKK
ncbi:UDP-2,4-diacetamido-2,4,6-trideoxy-beta-L-altropyranose hydrolase [Chloroflexota bacterium]